MILLLGSSDDQRNTGSSDRVSPALEFPMIKLETSSKILEWR